MSILKVNNVCKKLNGLKLKNISFELEEGKVTGLFGGESSGKTSLLKIITGMTRPDTGEIYYGDTLLKDNETDIKHRVGYIPCKAKIFGYKTIKSITNITKSFYKNWDEETYYKYIELYHLDENMMSEKLTGEDRVKYEIAVALAHKANILILDEPTEEIEFDKRSEFLNTFTKLTDEGITVLFSTNMVTDLVICKENVLYLENGLLERGCIKEDTHA